jgi:hypothetical protein
MYIGTLVVLLMQPVCLGVLLVSTALEVPQLLGQLNSRPLGWG